MGPSLLFVRHKQKINITKEGREQTMAGDQKHEGKALYRRSSSFFIKCKNIIDQKCARDQQYKKKGTKSLEQNINKTSLLNRYQREHAPLNKP